MACIAAPPAALPCTCCCVCCTLPASPGLCPTAACSSPLPTPPPAAAILLTNKASEAARSKYRLEHVVRVHLGADDTAYK